MRHLLNTLYVTLSDTFLAVSGENIVIKQDNNILARYPFHNLEDIVLFSYLGMSPKLIQKCMEYGIGICYLTPTGRFIARLRGESKGNILLRRKQYRVADDEDESLAISKNIICAKIYNEKWTVERYIRQYEHRIDSKHLKDSSKYLTKLLEEVHQVSSVEELMGIEGVAQATYFSCFDDMILNQKEHFKFEIRTRRPPLNPVNAMLSYIYSILSNEVASALESVGLDAYAGFMHTDRPGRISLALDLVEEFRAPIADRFVLNLINTHQIKENDFLYKENGAVLIKDESRRKVIKLWQNRKQKMITHPFLNEKIEWGLVPFSQAMLLARYLRGDLDGYPSFMWK
jgi:CRISPR-associated protein Cas1